MNGVDRLDGFAAGLYSTLSTTDDNKKKNDRCTRMSQ